LGGNLRYPPNSRDLGIQGRVYVQFTVNLDGTLSDFKILKGVTNDIDQEALRVMTLSPNWIPAIKRGISYKTNYTIPIFFQLGR
jgi:TonB family protein